MKLSIDKRVLEKYPSVAIGYLAADVMVKKEDPFVESLKGRLVDHLKSQGIDATQFVTHPSIALWRKIYEEDFHVSVKNYRSSIEALVRRIATGKKMWQICSVVDLYNCYSVLSLLPMGGYDLSKIKGEISLRFAKEDEPFWGLGAKESIKANTSHVVYADEKRILCWLWNYKDALETSIRDQSKKVIFFIDSFDSVKTKKALDQLEDGLQKIQCYPAQTGILNKNSPQAEI